VIEAATKPDLDYIARVTRVRAAAGVLFVNSVGHVLVVHPTYKDVWEIPGGTLEADESPREACQREIKEELGLAFPVGDVLCTDWVPPSPPWDGGLMFVFDGGVLTDEQISAIQLRSEELDELRFVDPSALDDILVPRLARRIAACLRAGRNGGVYLEDGMRPINT
jgi:8-oxo-dGTP pyrophosphatase MutT (NUDIX family)